MAIAFTLIETSKLNDINPQAWLTRALSQFADRKVTRLDELISCSMDGQDNMSRK